VNREEWHAVLATESATPTQVGALHGEFRRLGYNEDEDRAERLAVCATLSGLGELETTSDLTMGEAGRLINLLRQTRDAGELAALLPARGEHQGDEVPAVEGGMTLAQALARVIAIALAIWNKPGIAIPGTGKGDDD